MSIRLKLSVHFETTHSCASDSNYIAKTCAISKRHIEEASGKKKCTQYAYLCAKFILKEKIEIVL